MLVVIASLLRPFALHDSRRFDLDVGAHALFIAGMATAAVTRREWYHKALAATFLVLVAAYSLLLFGQLR